MVEYSFEEAHALLTTNLGNATRNLVLLRFSSLFSRSHCSLLLLAGGRGRGPGVGEGADHHLRSQYGFSISSASQPMLTAAQT